MRALLLCVVAACSTARRPMNPAATRSFAIVGDLVMRGEADGYVSVMASAVLDDVTAFGVVLLGQSTLDGADRSPHVVVARARAWHALSIMLDASPEQATNAAVRGVQLLPRCEPDQEGSSAAATRETLRIRLRCYARQHRLPLSTEIIRIDADTITQRDRDNEVTLIVRAELDGIATGGVARLRNIPFERAATATYAHLARARAWQNLARLLGNDVERSYRAAASGVKVAPCADHWRNWLQRGARIHEEGRVKEARDLLLSYLDDVNAACVRRYERRARYPKMHDRQAW